MHTCMLNLQVTNYKNFTDGVEWGRENIWIVLHTNFKWCKFLKYFTYQNVKRVMYLLLIKPKKI